LPCVRARCRVRLPCLTPGRFCCEQQGDRRRRIRVDGHHLPAKQHEGLMTLAGRLKNRLRRVLADERGFALVIALGVTVVLSMTVVTVIEGATSNQRSSTMTSGRSAAYNLAEAGSTTRCRFYDCRRTTPSTSTGS